MVHRIQSGEESGERLAGRKRSRENDPTIEQEFQKENREESVGSRGRASKMRRVCGPRSNCEGHLQSSRCTKTRKGRTQIFHNTQGVSTNRSGNGTSEVADEDIALLVHFSSSVMHESYDKGSLSTWQCEDDAVSAAHGMILLHGTQSHRPCRRSPRSHRQGSKYVCTTTWYIF
jgi:hypothetical protein